MRIAHLPLDSRPCNVLFPVQLAAWCGHECLIPQPDEMDHFTIPASFAASRDFLLREMEQADALAVSVDHLCYGSLLGSRDDSVDQSVALERLGLLEELHTVFPHKRIYAYSVIMRSSISTLYAADLAAYRAMTDYSVYTDRAAQTGDPEDAQRAQEARAQIPDSVLARYLKARERNHAVNRRCVELTAQGVLHSLALLQEDAELWGFHRQEQRALLGLKESLNAGSIWLHNGADEGGALTVMKALTESGSLPPVSVAYLGWPGGDFVARYEDRPFCENVNDSLAYAGLSTDEDAQTVLTVCCPPDGAQTDWEKPECFAGYCRQADEIAHLVQAGKQVYLLDQTRANGGSPVLMRAVYQYLGGMPLAGYSAWNTASNALGTMIAQIMSDQLAGRVNRAFCWERLLDDLAYQGAVREKLNRTLEERGEDPLHLKDPAQAQQLLKQYMQEWIASEPLLEGLPGWRVSLPWNRTFEIQLQIMN